MTHISEFSALLAVLFGVTLTPNPLAHIGDICPDAPIHLDHEAVWCDPHGQPVCVTSEQYHAHGLTETYAYCRQHGLHFAAVPGGRPNTQLIIYWRDAPCLLTRLADRSESTTESSTRCNAAKRESG